MDEILSTIRRIIADDEHAGTAGASGRGAANDGDENILELTRALNEDGTVRELAPIGGSRRAPASSPAGGEPARSEPRLTVDQPARGPAPAAAPAGSSETLASETTATASAAALARLATVRGERRQEPAPPRVGDRPLEEVVRELLRPLLRTWLDENLPELVERLVKAEIARITKKSGTG